MGDFTWVDWRAADGTALAARDYPAVGPERGLPVVCLHGLTRNSRDFGAAAPRIAAQGRRVLVPDVRGRGRSAAAADPASYQPATYVADLVTLLDQLALPRVVVVGTSMGGLVAMAMAAIAPVRLAAAIINDVGPELAPQGLSRISGYAGTATEVSDWAGAVVYARTIGSAAFPHYSEADWEAFARHLFREGPTGPELNYDPRIMQPMREAAARGAPAPDLWPLFDRLAEGGRPLLLVRGAISDLLTTETAARMRQRAPQMAYVEVQGVGHAPMLTEPDAQAALQAFLAAAP